LKHANLGVRFLLEVSALIVLGAWGWSAGGAWWSSALLAAGAVAVAAIAWGLVVSPKARIRAHWAVVLAVEAGVFGGAAAALAAMGRVPWAIAFGLTALVSRAIKAYFDSRTGPTPTS